MEVELDSGACRLVDVTIALVEGPVTTATSSYVNHYLAILTLFVVLVLMGLVRGRITIQIAPHLHLEDSRPGPHLPSFRLPNLR